MWVNTGEVPGDGLDNDWNGFVDDVYGWDFYDNDPDPDDENGHGTHVAGTIAAVGDNATGVTGVCWSGRIMALRFLGPDGTGHTVDAIDAIEYAVLNALEEAIRVAGGFDTLFVAAAGNENSDNDSTPHYPSSYPLDNIIAVAATGEDDALWFWEPDGPGSNWGANSVDLAAPGEGILSTVPGDSYDVYTGTSMATPHVSGTGALVWAQYPGLSALQVKDRLLGTVHRPNVEEPEDDPETVNPLAGKVRTEGRLDAAEAIGALRIATLSLPMADLDTAYSFTLEATGGTPPYAWDFPEGGLPEELNWLTLDPDTGELSGTPPEDAETGTFQVRVRVTDSATATDQRTFDFTLTSGFILTVRSEPFQQVLVRGWDGDRTDYTRLYPRPAPGEAPKTAYLKAPLQWAGWYFYRWEDQDGLVLSYSNQLQVVMDASKTVVAVYEPRQNFYVNDETPEDGIGPGDDANAGTSPAAPKRHIQAMLDAVAGAGEEGREWRILVAAGTYEENVYLGEEHSGLLLQGMGWEESIIDGGGVDACITADGWADGVIMDLCLTNGSGIGGGGGIRLMNGSSVTIIRNHIYGNSAPEGGAIAGYSCTATVKDNYIWGNDSDDDGGGLLFAESNPVIIEGNYIEGNSAYQGGGVRCWLSAGWITNNIIVGNDAEGPGGGIYCTGYWMPVDWNVLVENVASRGGGIFSYNADAPVTFNLVLGNQAEVAGGGICAEYFSDQLVSGNGLYENVAAYGGGLFCDQSNPPEITYNYVEGNVAAQCGGGIFLSNGISSPIMGNSIQDNSAGLDGGGIYLSENCSPPVGMADEENLNDISGNYAGRWGGGIYLSAGCGPTIGTPSMEYWANYFDLNEAGVAGGALYCGPDSAPTVLNSAMWFCSATLGAGVYCEDTSATFGNGSFSGANDMSYGSATLYGGGAYVTGEVAWPNFNANSFSSNTAEEGGGIYCDAGTSPYIGGGSIYDNQADYGAGLRVLSATPVLGQNLPVVANVADVEGGGIYMTDGSDVVMDVVYIYGNSAPVGAGLYCLDSSAELDTCTVEGQDCAAAGAGIRALNSELLISNSVIMRNSAPMGGGIFLDEGSSLLMSGTTLQENEADVGGGLYVAEAVASAEEAEGLEGAFNNVIKNEAYQGAGLYCAADATVTVLMSRFGESRAAQGAGIFCADGSAPVIQNCLLVGNSGLEGPGIYCSADAWPEIRNIGAIANAAWEPGAGAGLHSENPDLTIRNSIFWLNNEDLAGASASYCCIEDVQAGTGNFSGDPMMVGPVFTGEWGDPDPEDDDPEVVFFSPFGPPETDNFGDDPAVAGTTRFTAVGATGVAEDQFVGMWLNPNIERNVQFLIVGNTTARGGHNGGLDIYVRGDASAYGEAGDQFQIWDYHLMSAGGRWTAGGWVQDQVTSQCIDAGDPADPYDNESEPNGERINVGPYGDTYQASRSSEGPFYLVAESGTAWVDHDWTTVELTEDFTNPVVVVGPATSVGPQPGVLRVRNVTAGSFEVRFQEWDYLDGWHPPELVNWIAVERGTYELPGGHKLVADLLTTDNTNVYAPEAVVFPEPFDEPPVVLAQVMSYNGSEAVTDRICGVTAEGFGLAMQEQESKGPHIAETIGYIAVSEGATVMGNVACDVRRTAAVLTDQPRMVSTSKGSVMVRAQEEQSLDVETSHLAAEQVGLLGLDGQPPLVADIQTCNGPDPCTLRVTRLAEAFQMEHGVASAGSSGTTVALANTYVDPVVLVGPATYIGLQPGVLRVSNVTPTSFDVRFQEWNYLDGYHIAENLHYMVVERGAWQVQPGTLLLADELDTSNDNPFTPTPVTFPLPFDAAPVVVATQQTAAGGDAVTERLSAIGTEGFAVALQEEEAGGGHTTETIGYVAIGEGMGGVPAEGAAVPDVYSAATTGGSVAVTGWDIFITEEQSSDPETTHVEEVIGWFDFGYTSGVPYFVADMQTTAGTDPATLRCIQTGPLGWSSSSLGSLGLPGGESPCGVFICAREGGTALEGVEFTVQVLGADGTQRVEFLTAPAAEACEDGDGVTLTAPPSVLSGDQVLSFERWEVDGAALPAGETVAQIARVKGLHRAVALYTPPAPDASR